MLIDGQQLPPRLSTPADGSETPSARPRSAGPQGAHPAFDTLLQANIDLDVLPLGYLENYPYPAFVLVPGVPVNRDQHSSTFSLHNIQLLSPIWSNPCWRRFSGDCDNLLECLSLDSVRRLSFWLSGAFGAFTSTPTWAERRAEDNEENNPMVAPPTVTLEFEFDDTRTRLTLAKTLFPLYRTTDGQRGLISTHILTVITATPHGRLEFIPRRQRPTLVSSGSTVSEATSTGGDSRDSGEAFVPGPGHIPSDLRGKPLVLRRDGTVGVQPWISRAGKTTDGKPYSVLKLLKTTNWAKTPLGPREQWSLSLQLVVSFVMNLPYPASVWWGSDMCLIYNQLYAEGLPNHPHVFAQGGTAAWAELWPILGPLSELVLNGTPIAKEDEFCLASDSDGHVRETYRLQVWVPMKSETKSAALVHLWVDKTAAVIAERRAQLLYILSERASSCRTISDFDRAVLETLTPNPRDIPFALLYHVERTKTDPSIGPRDCTYVRLRYGGGVGAPEDHSAVPLALDVPVLTSIVEELGMGTGISDGLASRSRYQHVQEPWPFVQAIETGRPVLVQDCSGIIDGFPVRVWDELPTSALVIPIVRFSDATLPSTILIVGLSDRIPYGAVYQNFLRELRLELASHYAAVKTHQDLLLRRREGVARAEVQNLRFSAMTHEMFVGLSLISGPLDDYLADMPDSPRRDQLEMSRRSVYRMTRWLSLLSEMSSLEARRIQGSFNVVNLGEITGNIAATFRKPFESPRITYTVECDTTPHEVFVDRDKYERILFILIGNAFRFTVDGHVKVCVRYEKEQAVLAVEDTGVGIPADLLDLLNHPTSVQEGIDQRIIALTYCKMLVKMHGGRVRIESTVAPGAAGTTVAISLRLGSCHLPPECVNRPVGALEVNPLKQFHQSVMEDLAHCQWGWVGSAVERDPESSFANALLGIKDVLPANSTGLHFSSDDVVLVVDDAVETRRYLRGIFEPFCRVVEVTSAADAFEKTKSMVPDLIIADAVLPGMSGFELVARLRQGTRVQQMLPIILLTAREDSLPEVSFGADDYLPRPFNARELIARSHMQLQLGKKRRVLEAAYEQRTHELRILTDLIPVGIYRTTVDGWFIYANAKWHELTGYPRNQPIVNWGDYVCDEDKERIRDTWTRFLASDAPSCSGEIKFRNGRCCSYISLRLEGISGAPPGVLGCIVDITDRINNEALQKQKVEDALRRQAEAEEAKRQQEELIDITSHEIRNPISNMMQCASLVRSNLLQFRAAMNGVLENHTPFAPTPQMFKSMDEDLEALQSIYNCGLTQERISNDVLSLGKLQLGKLEIFHVATDIVRETQKLIGVFQAEAKMNLVELTLDIESSFSDLGVRAIMIDPVRYSQIVTNLVSNAIRFTSNSPHRRVKVALDIGMSPPAPGTMTKPGTSASRSPVLSHVAPLRADTPLYLFGSVADTGPGMTTAERTSLFQRFSQASAKTHTVFGGSGLGLFVCRKITERMGGSIDVESRAGEGSMFQFYLEVRPAPEAAPHTPPLSALGVKPKRVVDAHVLVVEDNVLNCKVLARQFSKVGIRVESVGNGLEALNTLRASQSVEPTRERYDLVLMDLEMPVMDGYTATKKLREEEAAGDLIPTAVIAFTGNARHAQIDEKMADFDDVVVKPYRINDMLDKIERVVKAGPRAHPVIGTKHVANGSLANGQGGVLPEANGHGHGHAEEWAPEA